MDSIDIWPIGLGLAGTRLKFDMPCGVEFIVNSGKAGSMRGDRRGDGLVGCDVTVVDV